MVLLPTSKNKTNAKNFLLLVFILKRKFRNLCDPIIDKLHRKYLKNLANNFFLKKRFSNMSDTSQWNSSSMCMFNYMHQIMSN